MLHLNFVHFKVSHIMLIKCLGMYMDFEFRHVIMFVVLGNFHASK